MKEASSHLVSRPFPTRSFLILFLSNVFPQVVARNALGQATTTVRVVLGDNPDSPDSPQVEAMTDTDILLSWKTPNRLNHSPVICYKVQMGYIGTYEKERLFF